MSEVIDGTAATLSEAHGRSQGVEQFVMRNVARVDVLPGSQEPVPASREDVREIVYRVGRSVRQVVHPNTNALVEQRAGLELVCRETFDEPSEEARVYAVDCIVLRLRVRNRVALGAVGALAFGFLIFGGSRSG